MPILLVSGAALLLSGSNFDSLATDVSGYARGVNAAPFDPAAPAWADGFELQLRGTTGVEETGHEVGVFGLLPLWMLVPYVGYEWIEIPGQRHDRGTLGLAARLGERLTLGVAYRAFSSHRPGYSDGTWDLGLSFIPASWLSVSLGGDFLNSPLLAGVRQAPALRAGAAVRPWAGAPWLTLAGDLVVDTDEWSLDRSRLLLDLGINGLHGLVAWEPTNGGLWFGASIALFVSELQADGIFPDAEEASLGRFAAAITVRSRPTESLVNMRGRMVEVPVRGELQVSEGGLLSLGPAIATLNLHLARLAEDPTVSTVILSIGKIEAGLASIEELRDAIAALRKAGKQVIAELSNADDKAFLVAAAADLIRLDTAATLSIDGFSVTRLFFAETLSKIGVRFDSVEVGTHKSGADALTRSEPRPLDTEVQSQILDQAFASLIGSLVQDRKLSESRARELVAQGAFTAPEALQAGLVDELTQPRDPDAVPVGRPGGEPLPTEQQPSRRWGARAKIAVVPIVGTIVTDSSSNPLPGESATVGEVVGALEEARRDADVAAVVVRIESGGGDVYASELMWRGVRRLAEVKPVIVSMGDVAASGGYYVAAPAHLILAEPSTLTGSIGIFALKADLSGLLEMAGVGAQVIRRGELADAEGLTHPLAPAARERLLHVLESFYDQFVNRVASGRHMDPARVRQIAEGRVYTGQQALALGLVDAMGGLGAAVSEAAARAGLHPGEYQVTVPSQELTLTSLLDSMAAAQSPPLSAVWSDLVRRVRVIEDRPLAMMPVFYEVGP